MHARLLTFRLGEGFPGRRVIFRTRNPEAKSGAERIGKEGGEGILPLERRQTRRFGRVIYIGAPLAW